MEDVKHDVEDMMVTFLTECVSKDERKEIWNGEDCLNALTHDAEEDIKQQLWDLVKSELNWKFIVDKVRNLMRNEMSCSDDEEIETKGSTTEEEAD